MSELGRGLPAGEEQATLVRRLGHSAQQLCIVVIARTKVAFWIVLLQQRFQVVQHEQTVLRLEALQQQVDASINVGWQGRQHLGREHVQAVGEQLQARRGIAYRPKDHGLERGGHLVHEGDRERRFADASHAQHAHHLAALLLHPLLQQHALGLAPVKSVHSEGIAPIEARRGG